MNKQEFKNKIMQFDGTDFMKNHCIKEILNRDVYKVFDLDPSKIKNIIDVGANIGIFSYICSQIFPDATIYAIEPSPINFQSITKNIGNIGKIKLFQKAIHKDSNTNITTTKIERNTGRNQAFVAKETDIPDCISISFVDFVKDIDYLDKTILKVDCEGCEKYIFDNVEVMSKFYQLSFELHRKQGREYSRIVTNFLNKIGETHDLILTTRTERVYRLK